ncbi:MAG: hypothetical protein AAF658_01415 [Myxococcota bacterium]
MRQARIVCGLLLAGVLFGCPDVSSVPETDPALIANSPEEAPKPPEKAE